MHSRPDVRRVSLAVAALALSIGASSCGTIKGRLVATTQAGQTMAMKSAYVVTTGAKSFRIVAASKNMSCAWALDRRISDEGATRIDVVVAPALDPTGKPEWRIASGRLSAPAGGDSEASAIRKAPIRFDGAPGRCPARVVPAAPDLDPSTKQDKAGVVLSGEFTPECCTPDVIPRTDAPLMVRVGAEGYPLTRAAWIEKKDGSVTVRMRAGSDPCSVVFNDGDDDLFLDVRFNPLNGTVVDMTAAGHVVRGSNQGYDGPVTLTRNGNELTLHGWHELRRMDDFDGPRYRIEAHGTIPIVPCAPGTF